MTIVFDEFSHKVLLKTPPRLIPLQQAHLIDEVVGQLQSGKEADVFVVLSEGEYRCAKVYKDANNRSFKQKTQYTEGRSVRSSRKSRAMESKSRFGRDEREREWQNTEVEALAVLSAAGVRVPHSHVFFEGVLILQMICGSDGQPAPRLNDVELTPGEARAYHQVLIREVVKMLCAGYVHGDLSEFNVLVAQDGLVIIDLPQAVQATANNAFGILERDLVQLAAYFSRSAPELKDTEYAKEIWKLYQNGKLRPDSKLTGRFVGSGKKTNVAAVLEEIEAAREDEMEKRFGKKE